MNMFKRKKSEDLIVFNRDKIHEDISKITDILHIFKDDECMKNIRYLIKLGKNISVLDCASSRNDHDRVMAQAKLTVMSDLEYLLESSVNKKAVESKEGKKPVTGTFNVFRRVSNQADISI